MDAFVKTHVATEGPVAGLMTMGYYEREDLPFYYALADHFTICDRFFTSAISGTVCNRIYGLTGMIDPDGHFGGPVISTPESNNQQDYASLYNALSWRTYPEVLEDAGVSWKVYNPDPPDFAAPLLNDNYLLFFKQYYSNPTLSQKAFGSQVYPADLIADIQNGTLPQVSWVLTPFVETEHPPAPIRWGEFGVGQALQALLGKPDVFAKTALMLTWDDSGGWFDHVPPPVAPPGTPGEYLTATPPRAARGPPRSPGPSGLGSASRRSSCPHSPATPTTRAPVAGGRWSARAPLTAPRRSVLCVKWLVSKGHSRSSVELPYDTTWRRGVVGDMTSAFSFGVAPVLTPPALTYPSAADFAAQLTKPECAYAPGTEFPPPFPQPLAYAPIPQNGIPQQEPGAARRPVTAECAPITGATPGSTPTTSAGPAASSPPPGALPNTSPAAPTPRRAGPGRRRGAGRARVVGGAPPTVRVLARP